MNSGARRCLLSHILCVVSHAPSCLPSFYGYILSVSLAARLPGAQTILVPHLQQREAVRDAEFLLWP